MRIHKAGVGTILFTLLALGSLCAGIFFWTSAGGDSTMNSTDTGATSGSFWSGFLQIVVYGGSLVLLALVLQFFRNPKRNAPPLEDNVVLAPADGKVVVIEPTEENEFLKGRCIQVSIFMSPLNVHVNRHPIDGEVVYQAYHPGKYLVAWHPKSSELNERTTVAYQHKQGQKIVMRQIAGAVARRLLCYVKAGDRAIRGEDMGFIRFGSRVDLFLPENAEILVNRDQHVRGKETAIARI
ncbi:MAG: phosphatidylserine decarboxylase family protein [Bacteroidota bacterium]